jgi:hypothetical protein
MPWQIAGYHSQPFAPALHLDSSMSGHSTAVPLQMPLLVDQLHLAVEQASSVAYVLQAGRVL